jgi:hypothetical protein
MQKALKEGFVTGDDADEVEPRRTVELAIPLTAAERVKEPPLNPEAAPAKAEAKAPPPFDPNKPPEDVQWPVVIKLFFKPTRNIKNEIIHALTMRAPTAKDIRQCGNPVRINAQNDVIAEPEAMIQMVALLSGCYPPMIEELDARDWNSVSFYMQRFFLPSTVGWPIRS